MTDPTADAPGVAAPEPAPASADASGAAAPTPSPAVGAAPAPNPPTLGDAVVGGVPLKSFGVVDDFVADCRAGRLSDEERTVSGSHPLAVLVEGTLEAVSRANLSVTIVGLSRRSESALVEERRKLEDGDTRPGLQRFLFAFEPLCQIVREAGYGGGDEGDAERFFTDLFPGWLEQLVAWATDEKLDLLSARAGAAQAEYLLVAADIAT